MKDQKSIEQGASAPTPEPKHIAPCLGKPVCICSAGEPMRTLVGWEPSAPETEPRVDLVSRRHEGAGISVERSSAGSSKDAPTQQRSAGPSVEPQSETAGLLTRTGDEINPPEPSAASADEIRARADEASSLLAAVQLASGHQQQLRIIRSALDKRAADAVREERAKNTAALKWLKERADWLVSEVRNGGTCYIERDQALYIHEKLRGILEGE